MSYPPGPQNPYGQQPPQQQPGQPQYGYPQQPGQPQQPPQQQAYGYPQYPQQAGYDPNAFPQQSAYGTAGAAYGGGSPELAGWGARFGSGVIDLLLVMVPYYILIGIGLATKSPAAAAALSLLGLLYMLGFWLFQCYKQGTTGQTIGKRLLGTRLLREDNGQFVGFGLSIGRDVCHILDGFACYIGYLWPLWDEKKQTFADKICKTLVVKSQ